MIQCFIQQLRFRHLICFVAMVFCASSRAEEIPDVFPPSSRNLALLAQKIRAGETVRVGFLGGSITQGAGAKNHASCYYWKTKDRLTEFAKASGGVKPEFLLAAVGGTGTLYGAYRVGLQLLDKNIDLLVVEFAVNDFKNPEALDGMEGIVRQALARNPHMAIVFFYTTNKAMLEECYGKGEWPASVAAFHRVAQHYNLAEVHAGPKVQSLFREGRMTPDTFFSDGTHPTDEGHAFYAEVFSGALVGALEAADSVPSSVPSLPEPLGSGRMEYARLSPVVPVEKSADWSEEKPGYYTYLGSWKATSPGASMSFDVTGERIYLLCGKTSRLRISGAGIDEKTMTPRNRANGTPGLQLIYEGPSKISGRITVTVEPDDKGNVEAELAGIAAIEPPPGK